jgi:hypothetical protein
MTTRLPTRTSFFVAGELPFRNFVSSSTRTTLMVPSPSFTPSGSKSAGGRGATGVESCGLNVGVGRLRFNVESALVERGYRRHRRLRVRQLRQSYSAAAIMIAAAGVANDRFFRLRVRPVTGMSRLPDATGMRRSGWRRQCSRERDKAARDRKKQKQCGRNATHAFVKSQPEQPGWMKDRRGQ